MDLITFKCPACKQVLKISADKAGRKAKCKCGAELTIPLVSEDLAAADGPAAAAKRSPAVDDEEEDSVGSYGLAPAPEPEVEKPKEEAKKAAPKPQDEEEQERKRRRRAALRKAPLDPVRWEKVRNGILLVRIAVFFWLLAFVLQHVILIVGIFAGPQYALDADVGVLLPEQQDPPPGEPLDLNKTSFVVGLLAGSDNVDTGLLLMLIGQILILLQVLIAIVGYCICLAVPPRFGAFGLLISVLILAGLNLILQLVFKLLPLAGAMDYTMIPLIAPEITMIMGNIGRMLPLSVYWSDAPFWEFLGALVIQMLFYAEPVLFCLFLRSVALSIRDEKMQAIANVLVLLALGTAFALVAFYLLSTTGTSEVLGWVLRVVYSLWAAFFLGQLVWYALVLQNSRERIAAKLAEEE